MNGPQLRRPSTFSVLAGSILYNEAKNLGKTFINRVRKRGADYLLGPPHYYNYKQRIRDGSLMALRRIRRNTTTRRRYGKRRYASRGYKRRVRRRTATYKRGRARRAMGTNAPAFRTKMRSSKYRPNIGERIGYHPSRKDMQFNTLNADTDKRLHAVRLVGVEYSDTDNVMNRRTGRLVDVIGVKFRAWFQLKQNLVDSSNIWKNPIHIRWAIINPKTNTGDISDITTGTNFFVADSPANEDAIDFPFTGNCFRYMNRKINPRRYGVIQEGTFLLGNDTDASQERVNMRSKKFMSFYVPIYRQMKWGNNDTGINGRYPNANLYFVYWFVAMGDKDDAQKFPLATAGVDQPLDIHYEKITYFRNPDVLNG